MTRDPVLGWLAAGACALAVCVTVLGAWVRLSDAGLGCPDWPGCYGQVDVPSTRAEIERANAAYPDRPVETSKAWKEMVHRYVAGALGLLVAGLAVLSWCRLPRGRAGPTGLAGIVVVQALLGMWTVTLLLKPVVVVAHLLGGIVLIAGLAWLAMTHSAPAQAPPRPRWLPAALLVALAVTLAQVGLGGWTSANYAALACGSEFPTCQGRWWPEADFARGFDAWHGLGVDYEGGILAGPARTAIHVSHRLGALVTTIVVGGVAVACLWPGRARELHRWGALIACVLALQVGLGIANVEWLLPLATATAHNGMAALLVLVLVMSLHRAKRPPSHGS